LLQHDRKTYESGAAHYSRYYDTASRRKIAHYYRDDIERFAYRFEIE
jgi:hypothetical protein